MSVKHRIRADQLQVGAPLPVDIYDSENRLLLRKGNTIATESQLERLIESGLFASQPLPTMGAAAGAERARPAHEPDDPLIDGPIVRASAKKPAVTVTRLSAYAQIVDTAHALEALLRSPEQSDDFPAAVNAMAQTISSACDLDTDAALAHILFSCEACYPVRQSINVAIITALLLSRMNNDPARTQSAVCAALTMNISVCKLLHTLYEQKDMTPEQSQALNAHPVESAKQLASMGVQDKVWLTFVEQHHEFLDGSGFPQKLKGAAIALESQVIGLADRYCSAVTERAYRAAVPPDVVLKQIREKSGAAIDPKLISGLVYWIGLYPPGTVVELFNRDIAVVTRRLQDLKHPMVCAVAEQNLRPFETPRKRATGSQPNYRIERILPRSTLKCAIDPEVLWPRAHVKEVAQSPEATDTGTEAQ